MGVVGIIPARNMLWGGMFILILLILVEAELVEAGGKVLLVTL